MLRQIILCLDRSGSMSASQFNVAASAAILAEVETLKLTVVAFRREVLDLSHLADSPADLILRLGAGGGTHIAKALAYCRQQVTEPKDTLVFLISDLGEGGDKEELIVEAASLASCGERFICLLGLNDGDKPVFNRKMASDFAELGIPTFGCTPTLLPELVTAAANGENLNAWAQSRDLSSKTAL